MNEDTAAMGTTLDEVKAFRQEMYDRSMGLVQKKGADYNRDQQGAGDTLFNIRVCEMLGVVPTAERGILVRLSDKLMRLISLVHPDRVPANTDESVMDTVADVHNYVDYMALLHRKRVALRQPAPAPVQTIREFTVDRGVGVLSPRAG